MNLHHRSYKKELLDQDHIPFQDIRKNMEELNFINRWLGGHDISIKGLKQLIQDSKRITICEIGCGGGDNIRALRRWCDKKRIDAKFIGIDIKAECIKFAESRTGPKDTEWITNDYKKVSFSNKPHIIFSSLFCHHFPSDELVSQLCWMKQNAVIGFFINDLQRHPLAYYSIKFFTSIFSSSYLVKNDAPLSVARGFKKNEWIDLMDKAGLKNYSIEWKWAFRYLITFNNE